MWQVIKILLITAVFVIFLEIGTVAAGFNIAFEETAVTKETAKTDELNLHAQSAVLMDASTGRILYGKNEDLERPMASTTKIMTCIIALENGNLSDAVVASQKAASQPKVHMGVYKGEKFLLKDLLYSLMLESHNDAAMMIAEHVGGSQAEFADMMNQKARDLGCANTYFITPNGLDAKEEKDGQTKEHSTTAADLCRIMNYCIGQSPKKKEFLEITGTSNYFFTDLDGKKSFRCHNHNALLSMMNQALSGKTGFTGKAGYSYVGAVVDDGRIFTIALLGCGWPPHKSYKWSDARKLFGYGMKNYHYKNVYQEMAFPDILVKEGIPSSGRLEDPVMVNCTMGNKEDNSLKLLLSEQEEVSVKTELPKELTAPVHKGQAVGTVIYRLNGEVIKTYPVYLTREVKKLEADWYLKTVLNKFLSMPGIFKIFSFS